MKSMKGRIVSTKMTKTVIVLVERVAKHPLYQKTFVRSKRYLVDDPIGVKMGDMVEIAKVKPISKNKHWRIVKVVGKNLKEITEEKLKAAAEETIAEVMPPSDAKAMEDEGKKESKTKKETLVIKEQRTKSKKEKK